MIPAKSAPTKERAIRRKHQILPLARVKKIMKSEDTLYTDAERCGLGEDAVLYMGKACEYFVRDLTVQAWCHTERGRRKTLQKNDLQAAISENRTYDFLIDIVPRVPHAGLSRHKSGLSGYVLWKSESAEDLNQVDEPDDLETSFLTSAKEPDVFARLRKLEKEYKDLLASQEPQREGNGLSFTTKR